MPERDISFPYLLINCILCLLHASTSTVSYAIKVSKLDMLCYIWVIKQSLDDTRHFVVIGEHIPFCGGGGW